MSNLKWQTMYELQNSKSECEKRIEKLEQQLNGQKERLRWINKYIFNKNEKVMTVDEIERILGHKVTIK